MPEKLDTTEAVNDAVKKVTANGLRPFGAAVNAMRHTRPNIQSIVTCVIVFAHNRYGAWGRAMEAVRNAFPPSDGWGAYDAHVLDIGAYFDELIALNEQVQRYDEIQEMISKMRSRL